MSKAFASVFSALVPAGRGRLIIQRKADRATAQGEDDSEDEQARNSVENYTGVGISVSFNSKHDEQQRIQQLSGGQKSRSCLDILALALCALRAHLSTLETCSHLKPFFYLHQLFSRR